MDVRSKGVLLDGGIEKIEDWLHVRMEISPIPVDDLDAIRCVTNAHVHAVVRSVVPIARKHVQPIRMIVEQDVDDVLITPYQLQSVLFVDWHDVLFPLEVPHSGEIHQHDAGIHAQIAVVRMTSEPIVPTGIFVLVLGCHAGKLRRIEVAEHRPQLLNRRQEYCIRIHV